MVWGLLGFIPGVSVIAIILACFALRRLRHSYDSGEGMAWMGLILGSLFTLGWFFVLIIMTF